MGSGTSGVVHRAGALHHVFKWFARGLIPVIPGTETTTVDLIASETVAKFVSLALDTSFEGGSIWHVAAGDQAALLREMAELAFRETRRDDTMQSRRARGTPFIVDSGTFGRLQASHDWAEQRVVRRAMDSITSFMPGLLYPRIYDTTRAQNLFGSPLACPDWRQTLIRMLDSSGLRIT